jgi:hypothetical protein
MPSRSTTHLKEGRRTGIRLVVAPLGAILVVGSLMTLLLHPASAGTSAGIPSGTQIYTALGPLSPSDPWPAPSTTVPVPPTTVPVPPTTVPVPPTTVPPVSGGVNSVDRILFSMNGPHQGAPHGVPTYWSWAQQPEVDAVTPPAGMTSLIGWGQIYSDATNVQPANVRVELRNMETYVWSNGQQAWTRVQGTAHVDGAHYVENFAGNTSIPTDLRAESDGGTSTGMTSGYNFHFWPVAARAALANPSDIGGVYTTVQARLILDNPNGPDNRNQARYLANTGADWWRTTTTTFGDGSNNPPVGQSRFTYLTTDWTAINFYSGGPIATAPGSWTETRLRTTPPPTNIM